MVPLRLLLAITQLNAEVDVWDTEHNLGERGMHWYVRIISVFPTDQVNQPRHLLKSQGREKPKGAMEGTGEEISRARLGVLSSLLAKAKGKASSRPKTYHSVCQ